MEWAWAERRPYTLANRSTSLLKRASPRIGSRSQHDVAEPHGHGSVHRVATLFEDGQARFGRLRLHACNHPVWRHNFVFVRLPVTA